MAAEPPPKRQKLSSSNTNDAIEVDLPKYLDFEDTNEHPFWDLFGKRDYRRCGHRTGVIMDFFPHGRRQGTVSDLAPLFFPDYKEPDPKDDSIPRKERRARQIRDFTLYNKLAGMKLSQFKELCDKNIDKVKHEKIKAGIERFWKNKPKFGDQVDAIGNRFAGELTLGWDENFEELEFVPTWAEYGYGANMQFNDAPWAEDRWRVFDPTRMEAWKSNKSIIAMLNDEIAERQKNPNFESVFIQEQKIDLSIFPQEYIFLDDFWTENIDWIPKSTVEKFKEQYNKCINTDLKTMYQDILPNWEEETFTPKPQSIDNLTCLQIMDLKQAYLRKHGFKIQQTPPFDEDGNEIEAFGWEICHMGIWQFQSIYDKAVVKRRQKIGQFCCKNCTIVKKISIDIMYMIVSFAA